MTDRLNIEQICALTPQAKGRVERSNQTMQDRLVKNLFVDGPSLGMPLWAQLFIENGRHPTKFSPISGVHKKTTGLP
jgi:hypothetical protein